MGGRWRGAGFGAAVAAAVVAVQLAASAAHKVFYLTQLTMAAYSLLVVLGLALLLEADVLTHPASIAGTPDLEDVVFAFPLVLVAFSGIDASSGLAGSVAPP